MNMITSSEALKDACAKLRKADFITLDTEFIRETTFFPELCLIQLAGPDEAYAVDALADGLDLAPLYKILLDKKVLKVIHSGRQDLEIFYQLMGKLPIHVFDTQIAAMVCGYGESASYETLVSTLTKHKLDKSQQSSNWKHRPLTQKQIKYALEDVIFLREVYDKLKEKITELDRMSWLMEEEAWLLSEDLYKFTPENAYKKLRPRRTDPLSMYLLKELAAWRETEARDRNVPKRRVLQDDALMEFAAFKPSDVSELKSNRVLRNFQKNALAEKLVTLTKGLIESAPDFEQPEKQKHIPYSSNALEIVKLLLRLICDEEKVASKLVATTEDLKRLVKKDYQDKSEILCLTGWRYELFGEKALKVLEGKITFGLEKGKIKFVEK